MCMYDLNRPTCNVSFSFASNKMDFQMVEEDTKMY